VIYAIVRWKSGLWIGHSLSERGRTCVSASVPFEVKRVVESLAAQSTQVSLDVTVTLDVSTQHSLLRERLAADAAPELVVCRLFSCIPQNRNTSAFQQAAAVMDDIK